ncbi:4-hydroxyphenylpyruvate dioxygenase [Oceanicella sp. SM1341]|uniref:4-hydroxyphenylpyruvate dioxygenase n=1 Tax=Oceanicella sp. SM1341 TaxID=1548889 RepID=UPI000E53BB06|nr:4-hydroxyphenylpyruvate dioxygenase [Oceanicella sp. SM1341]
MGPFPHDAPPAEISKHNPAGTDGFEFVEFAHPDPEALRSLFAKMGFECTAKHREKDITLWQQGDITYVLNAEPGSFGMRFVEQHGPCAPSMAWRVVDAQHAYERAIEKGAKPYEGGGKVLDVPAIEGIGGSLIYFVETYGEKGSPYAAEYERLPGVAEKPEGVGFFYLDHLTHNVNRGNMDTWFNFYADIFNFRQIRYFDIEGKMTGLFSRALTSPCGRIRIPINESADEHSQIEEYLREYKGEGIQHIAVATNDIYKATDEIHARGLSFMPPPPPAYYAMSHARVKDHEEPLEKLKKHGILIDGEGVVDGGETRILLQIFSKTVIGPIFFEFIQRKGDDGFGEGNFRALFESIEQDQIDRGVIGTAAE